MRISLRQRPIGLALALVLLPLAAGCAFKPDTGGGGPGPTIPLNTTPENLMARFDGMYEAKNLGEYKLLFTSDFRFTFSSQSDAELVTLYGNSWGKDDEVESTSHLFEGFQSSEPPDFPTYSPATNITMDLRGPQYLDDLIRPDSSAFYKYVVVPTVDLQITVFIGSVETTYEISAPHDFYLVRGDVAQLDPDQEASADRWYIYRWDDKSPRVGAAVAPRLSSTYGGERPVAISWGHLKGSYAP
jgi:hypothetical protein